MGRWLDRVPVDASLSIVWGASMHSSRVDVFCRGVPFANREWSPVWLELTGFIAHLIPSSPPPFPNNVGAQTRYSAVIDEMQQDKLKDRIAAMRRKGERLGACLPILSFAF